MNSAAETARCQLCGEPMPKGEEMFNYHGFSGPCPKPPMAGKDVWTAIAGDPALQRARRLLSLDEFRMICRHAWANLPDSERDRKALEAMAAGIFNTAERKIVTSHEFPPIPDRQFDWCAHYEGEEEAGGYGYGRTEAEAIQDFKDNYQADHDERLA